MVLYNKFFSNKKILILLLVVVIFYLLMNNAFFYKEGYKEAISQSKPKDCIPTDFYKVNTSIKDNCSAQDDIDKSHNLDFKSDFCKWDGSKKTWSCTGNIDTGNVPSTSSIADFKKIKNISVVPIEKNFCITKYSIVTPGTDLKNPVCNVDTKKYITISPSDYNRYKTK